jgi:GT2 family glycosyltransferase/SAM-dependent methyltransferase
MQPLPRSKHQHAAMERRPARATTLLRETAGIEQPLDYDQAQRYSMVASLLNRMLDSVTGRVRILEVGCNILDLLPTYLDPERVEVIGCDVERFRPDDHFVLIERDQPLPFESNSFDAVVSLEVLEHIAPRERLTFLADCLRIARHGAIFTCPNGVPQVVEAERWASHAYRDRHGTAHPYLAEHAEFGLPTEAEIREHLARLECSHAVFENAPLDDWLAMMVMSEISSERGAPEAVVAQLRKALATLPAGNRPAYRKIYVCAKTFDATQALEPLPVSPRENPAESAGPSPVSRLAEISCAALIATAKRREALEAANENKSFLLEEQTRKKDAAIEEIRQRQVVLNSMVVALTGSRKWRLGAPLRALRQLLRPRRLRASDLIPTRQLIPTEHGEPGAWTSTGNDPQFLAPCLFPAGWLRVQLRVRSSVQGRLEILADHGCGFREDACLVRLEMRRTIKRDFYVYLERPACALRLDPLDVEGEFHLLEFRVEYVPGPKAFVGAMSRKLKLLYQYGVMGRTFRNGLFMLARGDLRGVRDKILLGLNRASGSGFEAYDGKQAYADWCDRHELSEQDRRDLRGDAAALVDPPLISILTPVYNTPAEYLRLAIDSVRRQLYPNWELCLADDASTEPHVRSILEEYAARDPRIRVSFRPENGNISAASNTALAMARGEYVALLDHDDELAEQALLRMAQAIVADRELDFLYSDEDKMELDGTRLDPFFKPDWSPEYFLSCMYTCHLGVYRTALVRAIGGFRSEFDSAQDYDLALRVVARKPKIHHVADVLYHWRKLPTSTAVSHAAKPQAHEIARRAVQSYLDLVGTPGQALAGPVIGFHRVRYKIQGRPLVSIVIPTAGREAVIRGRPTSYLAMCIESIKARTSYKNYEIVVVDNDDLSDDHMRLLDEHKVRRISFTEPFNLASKMNLGGAMAAGDYLLFLNDDIEVISPDWIESMLEFAQQSEIGGVGARLYFPDGRLQHVGVTILDGNPGHPFYGAAGENIGYFCGNVVARNYAAVTGACFLTRAEVFQEVGGFSEAFPLNYNDVDLCLRIGEQGYRIVYVPYARLYHHESASKEGVYETELQEFQKRWCPAWRRDPYYNPHLSIRHGDFRIAAPLPAPSREGGDR